MKNSSNKMMMVFPLFFLGLFMLTADVWGFDEVNNSRHDFFGREVPGSELSACDVCHLEPEGTASAPLWDSSKKTVSFPVDYPPTPSQRRKKSLETKPVGPSFKCLACHDGVLGNDVHRSGLNAIGKRGDFGEDSPEPQVRPSDHPDSVIYPRSSAGRLISESNEPRLLKYWSVPDKQGDVVVIPTGPTSAALGLQGISPDDPIGASRLVRTYEGMIHCDSCHNPHNNETRPFLRLPHQMLCLACHDR